MAGIWKLALLMIGFWGVSLTPVSYSTCPGTPPNLSTPPKVDEPFIWDLNKHFEYPKGVEDPQIDADIKEAQGLAKLLLKFNQDIMPNKSPPARIAADLEVYQKALSAIYKPYSFLRFHLSVDRDNVAAQTKMTEVERVKAEVEAMLIWVKTSMAQAPDTYIAKLLVAPELAKYRDFIASLKIMGEFSLGTERDALLARLAPSFDQLPQLRLRFLSDHFSSFEFQEPGDPAPRVHTRDQMQALEEEHPDPNVRFRAAETRLERFAQYREVFADVYRGVVATHVAIQERERHMPKTLFERAFQNGLSIKSVEDMLETVRKNFHLAQRYYAARFKLLGISNPTTSDIFVPYSDGITTNIPWSEGRQWVIDALHRFSPELSGHFERLCVADGCIHARPLPKGKDSGAYVESWTPVTEPVLMMSYTGTLGSPFTLAHEGGHLVHVSRMRRHQPLVNFTEERLGYLYGETPSTFNERLLAHHLHQKFSGNKKAQAATLILLLDGLMSTVFRQAVLALFENEVFKLMREGQSLSADDFAAIYEGLYRQYLGDIVALTPHFKYGWAKVSHFIETPFYVHSYTGSGLASSVAFKNMLRDPQAFAEQYLPFLDVAASVTKAKAYQLLRMNLDDPTLWQQGLDVIGGDIIRFEALVGEILAQ